MLVEVKVPQLSESVSEATLLAWHKKPGEYVQRDENLIDIETDKVVLELPAPQAGLLTKIVKGDGGTVVSNEVIATIDTDAKAPAASKVLRVAPVNKEPKPKAGHRPSQRRNLSRCRRHASWRPRTRSISAQCRAPDGVAVSPRRTWSPSYLGRAPSRPRRASLLRRRRSLRRSM